MQFFFDFYIINFSLTQKKNSMSKTIFILSLIAVVAFTQPVTKNMRTEDAEVAGGYQKLTSDELAQLEASPLFMTVQKAAKNYYNQHTGATLGAVLSVEQELVSGVNYKITFAPPQGLLGAQNVVIVVYTQSWSNTVQVVSVYPSIFGVTDVTGKVLAQLPDGGYQTLTADELTLLEASASFIAVEKAARDFYNQHTGNTLSAVLSVEQQVVSGVNYKITFNTPLLGAQKVVMVVYNQPWSNKIQVVSVYPSITGVTDENGNVLAGISQN